MGASVNNNNHCFVTICVIPQNCRTTWPTRWDWRPNTQCARRAGSTIWPEGHKWYNIIIYNTTHTTGGIKYVLFAARDARHVWKYTKALFFRHTLSNPVLFSYCIYVYIQYCIYTYILCTLYVHIIILEYAIGNHWLYYIQLCGNRDVCTRIIQKKYRYYYLLCFVNIPFYCRLQLL